MWVTLECAWCAQQKSSYSDPGQIAEGWTGTPCLGGLKVWATECRDPQVLQDQNCFQRNVTHDYQAEYNAIHNKDESAPSLLCVRWLLTSTGSRLLCSSPGGTQVRKRRFSLRLGSCASHSARQVSAPLWHECRQNEQP